MDDPLDAFSIHGICGIWGVLASGIFNKTEGLINNQLKVFGGSLLGIVVIICWTTSWAFLIF